MRLIPVLIAGWVALAASAGQDNGQEISHFSQVMGAERVYRVHLPPSYATSKKRMPVIYWMHGFEESAIRETQTQEFDKFVAAHDAIVVDFGPIETTGLFPLYFPELVERVDDTLRTIADRQHRGIAGYSKSGFLAQWTAAKFPDLVASTSAVAAIREAPVGPAGFEVDCNLDDLDFSGIARAQAANVGEALDFELKAFEKASVTPAVFSHSDPYPNFTIWGWEVVSNRRQPGFTRLEHASTRGFHASVREWLPGGAELTGVELVVETPPHWYPAGSSHAVTFIHVQDGKIRRAVQKADGEGRLSFNLDGDEWEVGISDGPSIAVSGYEVASGAWATAGQPVTLRVKFWNVGAARSGTLPIQWESPNPAVKFDTPVSRLFGLGSGESATLPITFTPGPEAGVVRIVAAELNDRTFLDLPLYPAAEASKDFVIADGKPIETYLPDSSKKGVILGEGNGDGNAAPGESFAILLPEGKDFHMAELFTNDACVDNTVRLTDGAASYSVARILPECQPGRRVHMLARVEMANHAVRYATIELPVWYKN